MCHKLSLILIHRIVIVNYVETDPYQTFQALFEEEIKILVYHGQAQSYLDTLLVAQAYGFAENE